MEVATIKQIFENEVWVEVDILGNANVMIQSKGSEACVCAAIVRYAYPFIDNATRNSIAINICESLGAKAPIEFKFRDMAGMDLTSEPESN